MTLVLVAFLAGILTVASPCVLPLLPVIVGGSLVPGQFNWKKALRICLGLAVSVIVFTLLLRATTALLGVPQSVWQLISGVIIAVFGLQMVLPRLWERTTL